jgi:cytochrome c
MKPLPLLLTLLLTLACNRAEAPAPPAPPPAATTHPDATRGQQLIPRYACNVCHVIPGLEGNGRLGPALAGVASRPAISGGHVPNTPENLRKFIQNPASLNPQTAMPPIQMPDADAADIAAFLQTLK